MKAIDYSVKINGEPYMDPIAGTIVPAANDPTPEMYKKYSENNGLVAYVTENGEFYLSPYGCMIVDELEELGYKKDPIVAIPFGVPANAMRRADWAECCKLANEYYKKKAFEESQEKYKAIMEYKGLKPLPEDIKNIALEIPADGLKIINVVGEEARVNPIAYYEFGKRMGEYYDNNGIVLFPDTVGKTYISPFYSEIIEILKNSGYRKGNAPVPLSNGERITNPPMWAAVWIELCKQAAIKQNEPPTTGSQIRH